MDFDTYNLKARIYPTLIVLLPVVLLSIYYIINFKLYFHYLTLTVSVGFFSYILSQLGRDSGKRREEHLFQLWGGKPTTQLLRFNNQLIDIQTKSRYHRLLSKNISDITLPTPEFEKQNPQVADEVYDCCTTFLKSRSRDVEKFKIIHQENTNYGFRRNVYGLKKIGVVVVILCLIVHLLFATKLFSVLTFIPNSDAYLYILFTLLILFWLFIVNANWVKIVAVEYAKRLYEQLNEINTPQ